MKQVKMHDTVWKNLDDLARVRRDSGALVKTKQDIVADFINKAHKKECKS